MCVALIGLYNKLAPRPIGGEMKAANSVAGNIDIEQEESVGMDISPTMYVLIWWFYSRVWAWKSTHEPS